MIEEAFMWLGFWLLIANIFALPVFFYLRRIPRKKFVYIMFVLHHWLQNCEKGYGYEEVVRDLAKVDNI